MKNFSEANISEPNSPNSSAYSSDTDKVKPNESHQKSDDDDDDSSSASAEVAPVDKLQ